MTDSDLAGRLNALEARINCIEAAWSASSAASATSDASSTAVFDAGFWREVTAIIRDFVTRTVDQRCHPIEVQVAELKGALGQKSSTQSEGLLIATDPNWGTVARRQ